MAPGRSNVSEIRTQNRSRPAQNCNPMKPLRLSVTTMLLCLGMLLPAACRQSGGGSNGAALSFREDFETGSKRAYTAGEVKLGSGSWLLEGALLGNSPADLKLGDHSLRIAPGGKAEMRFDFEALPDTLSFFYGPYGNDRDVNLSLWYSNNGGRSWKEFSKNMRNPNQNFSTAQFEFTLGFKAPIRFSIHNDGTGRVNVDRFGTGAPGKAPAIAGAETPKTADGGPAQVPAGGDNSSLLLGNPSNAKTDPSSKTNYLLEHPEYTLSYNDERGTANWVSWHLSLAEQGNAPRCNCFSADAALPEGFYRVQTSNYIGSGFDRGHICPSDDRSGSPSANAATFLMPNIAPQAPDLNQKCWKELEEYARRLSEDRKELYVISGCYGSGGTGSKGAAKSISNGRITVPAHFWKIVLVLPEGNNDLKRITPNTEVIAVDMPNTQTAGSNSWQAFRCTILSIERATGYRFFTTLPPDVAKALRTK
jgi:endonuclease G